MPTYYGLHGQFIAADGARDALAAILLEAAASLRRNPGCLLYVIHVAEDDQPRLPGGGLGGFGLEGEMHAFVPAASARDGRA